MTSSSTSSTSLPSGADAQITLSLEPDSKADIILNAIAGAQKSIWIEMYTFTHPAVAQALAAKAADSAMDVRLLYEPRQNQNALLQLTPDSQFPKWAKANLAVGTFGSPVSLSHAKFMLIDSEVDGQAKAYIMTTNFTEAALGGSWQCTNRDYILCDTNPQDIQMLRAIFLADQQGASLPALSAPNLLVTGINAHLVLRELIDSAQQSIYIQVESFSDPNAGSLKAQNQSIEGGLLKAAQNGRDVRVMLPPLPGANTTMPTVPNNTVINTFTQANPQIAVTTNSQYYMHAKTIIVDQRLAFVGSQNLTRESLNYSREVGILISNADILKTLNDTFLQDWQGAQTTSSTQTSASSTSPSGTS